MLSPNSHLSSRSFCIAANKSLPSRSLGKASPVHCCHGTNSVRHNPISRVVSMNHRLFWSLPAAVKRVGVQSARWTKPLQIFRSGAPKWTLHSIDSSMFPKALDHHTFIAETSNLYLPLLPPGVLRKATPRTPPSYSVSFVPLNGLN